MSPRLLAAFLTVMITLLCSVKMWLSLGEGQIGEAVFFFFLTAMCLSLDLGLNIHG